MKEHFITVTLNEEPEDQATYAEEYYSKYDDHPLLSYKDGFVELNEIIEAETQVEACSKMLEKLKEMNPLMEIRSIEVT